MDPFALLFGLGAAVCYAILLRAWVRAPAPGPATRDAMHDAVEVETARRQRLSADEVVTKGMRAAIDAAVAEDVRRAGECANSAAWAHGGICSRCGVPHRSDPPQTPTTGRGQKVWS